MMKMNSKILKTHSQKESTLKVSKTVRKMTERIIDKQCKSKKDKNKKRSRGIDYGVILENFTHTDQCYL